MWNMEFNRNPWDQRGKNYKSSYIWHRRRSIFKEKWKHPESISIFKWIPKFKMGIDPNAKNDKLYGSFRLGDYRPFPYDIECIQIHKWRQYSNTAFLNSERSTKRIFYMSWYHSFQDSNGSLDSIKKKTPHSYDRVYAKGLKGSHILVVQSRIGTHI